MFNKAFMQALAERSIKTFCQALAALLLAGATNLLEVDWVSVLATAGMTTLLSVLTTLGSGVVTGGNASLATGSEVTTDNGLLHLPDDGQPVR